MSYDAAPTSSGSLQRWLVYLLAAHFLGCGVKINKVARYRVFGIAGGPILDLYFRPVCHIVPLAAVC